MKYLMLFLATLWFPTSAFSQINKAAEASNQFAFELYNQIAKTPGNLFFSPLSIEAALAMTTAGAQKETLSQMTKTLHLAPNYHPEFRTLLGHLKGSKDFQLLIANRIWGGLGTEYYPSFLKLLQENYGANLSPLDFKTQPEPSRLKINQWVQQQTKDKIKDLLPDGTITPETDLVLTNAIYFKGSWTAQFEKELTKNDTFLIAATQKMSIPFMHRTSYFKYAENPELQLLEMTYKGNELVMDVLLPNPGVDLSLIEKKLTSTALGELIRKAQNAEVDVSIPKFKAESQFDLGEKLKALGMPLAFDPKKADFQGIRKIRPGDNLYISKVIHKAFVDVNEKGTEAAAATGMEMMMETSIKPPPKIFKADHPFLFFIRHLKSGAILFMGRYSQP